MVNDDSTFPPDRIWHALHADEAVLAMQSNAEQGLDATAVEARRLIFGLNRLPEAKSRTLAEVFFRQFKSPLIFLLLGAAVLAFLLDAVTDAIVILAVVLLNALIGAFQEGRAERSLEALRRLTAHDTRVVRNGRESIVPAADLVPGDIIALQAGDLVPADARLVDGAALEIAEAALTGESLPVAKALPPLPSETQVADRRNMLFAGTHVTAGRARAVVVATGGLTELGRIAALAGNAVLPKTPLERRIDGLGRSIVWISLLMFVSILIVGFLHGFALGAILMVGISQLVGMVPEGLPVALTVALTVGVDRMAKRRAIVRRLSAVETLGSTTVICADKTGTLTRNQMTAKVVKLPGRPEIVIDGAGYVPIGDFSVEGRTFAVDRAFAELCQAAALCNDARLLAPDEQEPTWRALGDPTEVALLTLAVKAGQLPSELRARFPRRAEIPFDSSTKLMATQHEGEGNPFVLIKGAPEMLLAFLADFELAEGLRRDAEMLADRALRVLAFGRVDGLVIAGDRGFEVFRGRVRPLGLVGQIDPPRPEVKAAAAACRSAGIRPIMVTGDHKATGLAIARELEIWREGDLAIDGAHLETLDETTLASLIPRISVFARVHPAQKLRIVQALQKRGEVVAMTGDGVNDAPALIHADVGVAMGFAGTEVAREAAKIVITDDHFATIVAAVEEGRVVYRNIKKTLLLLFSTSIAEVIILFLALLAGYPPPFAAVQILWNNLVTEGLITVNLVLEPAEGDEMRRPPIPADEPLLTRLFLTRSIVMVAAIATSTLGWFIVRLETGVPAGQVRTEAFTLLAVCEWFNVLNCRSETKTALNLEVLRNPWLLGGLLLGNLLQVAVVFWSPLGRFFHTEPFDLQIVIALGVVGSLVLWVEELRKLIVRRSFSWPSFVPSTPGRLD